MDVEPLVPFRGHRRQMRRPVAGGLPAPDLESWLEPLEDQPTGPSLFVAGTLVAAGMVAAALIGVGIAQLLWNRLYRDLTG